MPKVYEAAFLNYFPYSKSKTVHYSCHPVNILSFSFLTSYMSSSFKENQFSMLQGKLCLQFFILENLWILKLILEYKLLFFQFKWRIWVTLLKRIPDFLRPCWITENLSTHHEFCWILLTSRWKIYWNFKTWYITSPWKRTGIMCMELLETNAAQFYISSLHGIQYP